MGDLDGMAERHVVRMLVVYNKTNYFLDGPQQRGATYDMGVEFEKWLNRDNKDKTRPIRVVFIPTSRDHLLTDLQEGRGDIAAAGLAITPERQQLVSFATPFADDVSEIVVTSAEATVPATVEGLSGQSVYVRRSSSYYTSLEALNARLKTQGKPPVKIVLADENLEDEDILEMMNAGIIDSHRGRQLPRDVLATGLHQPRPHPELVLARPQRNRLGHSQGFSAAQGHAGRVRREEQGRHRDGQHDPAALPAEHEVGAQRDFGRRHEALRRTCRGTSRSTPRNTSSSGCCWWRRASRNPDSTRAFAARWAPSASCRSCRPPRGTATSTSRTSTWSSPTSRRAPNTCASSSISISTNPASTTSTATCSRSPPTTAARTESPGCAAKRRASGLDADKWFNNVELLAAEQIGRETVQYVSNIYKYYVAYKLVLERAEQRDAARAKATAGAQPPAKTQ